VWTCPDIFYASWCIQAAILNFIRDAGVYVSDYGSMETDD
jgi:hypothetical protein